MGTQSELGKLLPKGGSTRGDRRLSAVTLLVPCSRSTPPLEGNGAAHMAQACSDVGSADPKYSRLPHFLREVGPSMQTAAKIPGDSVPERALSNTDRGARVSSAV